MQIEYKLKKNKIYLEIHLFCVDLRKQLCLIKAIHRNGNIMVHVVMSSVTCEVLAEGTTAVKCPTPHGADGLGRSNAPRAAHPQPPSINNIRSFFSVRVNKLNYLQIN